MQHLKGLILQYCPKSLGMLKHSLFFSLELGPSPAHEKTTSHNNPPPPLCLMQSNKYCSPGNHQTQTRSSDYQMVKLGSSLQRTCLHCIALYWACFTPLHLMLCITPSDVWCGCSCSAMETHSIQLSTHCS